MNNDIKAGDLFIVIKLKPCCNKGQPGKIFKAISILNSANLCCAECGYIRKNVPLIEYKKDVWIEPYRLKKIDPPALQDEAEKELELAL